MIFATGAPDWETIKVLAGGGLGVFGFYCFMRIIKWLIDMILTRDKNQTDRDDKRDVLLAGVQTTVATQDKAIHDMHKLLTDAIARNERNWDDWRNRGNK